MMRRRELWKLLFLFIVVPMFLPSLAEAEGKRIIRRFPIFQFCPFRSGHVEDLDQTNTFTFAATGHESTVWMTVDGQNEGPVWNGVRLDNIVVVEASAMGPDELSCYQDLANGASPGTVESYDFDPNDPRVAFFDFFVKGGNDPALATVTDTLQDAWRMPADVLPLGRAYNGEIIPGDFSIPAHQAFWVLDAEGREQSTPAEPCDPNPPTDPTNFNPTPCLESVSERMDGSLGLGRKDHATGGAVEGDESVTVGFLVSLTPDEDYAVLGLWGTLFGNTEPDGSDPFDELNGVAGEITWLLKVTTLDASDSVLPGGVATVTLADGPANPGDFVGLYEVGAPDTDQLDFQYLDGTQTIPTVGQDMATLNFPMPSTPGEYEFRLFQNDDIGVRLASSDTVTVQDIAVPGELDGDGDVDWQDLRLLLTQLDAGTAGCPRFRPRFFWLFWLIGDWFPTWWDRYPDQLCGLPSSGPGDPADLNQDGLLTVQDARQLVTHCTRASCAAR